jgi:mannose-6-phosphate isomerase-like protein (cupin superfamily)
MNKPQDSTQNKFNIRVVKWEKDSLITQEEAEARLQLEGYHSFCWYDVPGSSYPKHRHSYDECIWILKGEIHFIIEEMTFILKRGDRIYLPAKTPHIVQVPISNSVTYLIGQKN